MILNKKTPALLLLLSLTLILLLCWFYPLSLSPNTFLFSSDGDGLKNYYSPLYHIQHGAGTHFEGMFYPYGCHIVYPDAQPLIVALIQSLSEIFPGIKAYSTGILNGLILISFLVAAYFIFRFLSKLSIAPWACIILTLPILFLSPQMYRIWGHYGLAYVCFIPMWLCFLQDYHQNPRYQTLIWIFFTVLLASFLHPYYSLIALCLFGPYVLFAYGVRARKDGYRQAWPALLPLGAVMLAFMSFVVFVKFTDSPSGAIPPPYGLMAYRAKIEGLFLPLWGPLVDGIDHLISVDRPGLEAYNYLGLPVVIYFFTLLYLQIKRWFKPRNHSVFQVLFENTLMHRLWLGSLIVLLLAMAFPFRLGMFFLLDWIPALKQFRSLGRLAWVVYYIQTFTCAWLLWHIYQTSLRQTKRGVVQVFLALGIFTWYADAYIHARTMRENLHLGEGLFTHAEAYTEKVALLDTSRFQAIVCAPMFFVGTDKYGEEPEPTLAKEAMLLSYYSGLPLVDAQLARLPNDNSTKLWSAFAHPIYLSDYWIDLPNAKSLLVLSHEKIPSRLDTLISGLKVVGKSGPWTYRELPADFIARRHELFSQKLQTYLKSCRGQTKNGGIFVDFEDQEAPKTFWGKGALQITDTRTWLFKDKLPASLGRDSLELSFWVYNHMKKVAMPHLLLEVYNAEGQKLAGAPEAVSPDHTHNIYLGWHRYAALIPPGADSLSLHVRYTDTWVDALALRPLKDTTVRFMPDSKEVLWNNFKTNFPKP